MNAIPGQRPPLPPFGRESAPATARAAEDAWNTRDPEHVAHAYSAGSSWRNRSEFLVGQAQIVPFLRAKWRHELNYPGSSKSCGPTRAVVSPPASLRMAW